MSAENMAMYAADDAEQLRIAVGFSLFMIVFGVVMELI